MITVDARGLSCPEPVLMTKNAVEAHKGEQIRVLVSEPHSCHNVEKFAKSQKLSVEIREVDEDFELTLQ